ncbi:MAG TPA: OFA family MFS transporter [Aliidongia sp.]|uniref:L-lactate MFS transporter n=1 Tax=Aliidongia sp. TaxID=1914230 RepID=UPI002DDDA37F|nr:OFA family MFS transporter [Aliidongia sp.]HEV2674849.1 OFA family MFS transporter [Aliidongia sp.]
MSSFLDRAHTIAPPGYNRFMVPPAALAVHLAIGQAYAFSTFNLPLTKLIGITKSAPDDWNLAELGWIFSIAIVFLGVSAAVFGRWVENVGPRKAMFTAALCFGGGFLISAVGIHLHALWLLYLGYGVLGGCGLGIGYISPVSTLIKWFPDRPGMATGMAIMGFGGGAMIAAPLSVFLMNYFKSATSTGLVGTFVVMGVIYFVFMMIGVYAVRVPAADWKPAGWVAPTQPKKLVTTSQVHVDIAWRTKQFWLLWAVLCLNVTAGIGVIGQASPMIQEMFGTRITPTTAAGFVGLLSLFNMGGRFFWATTSDYLGRRNTYMVFFLLGIALYALVPTTGQIGSVTLFVAAFAIIISMYGGGFATVPAYLRDVFGTMHVGAIHGRLLTAWSAAGVLGPVLVNYIRQYQIEAGVPKAQAYSITMYIMCGLLLVGFLANLAMRAVEERHHYREVASAHS